LLNLRGQRRSRSLIRAARGILLHQMTRANCHTSNGKNHCQALFPFHTSLHPREYAEDGLPWYHGTAMAKPRNVSANWGKAGAFSPHFAAFRPVGRGNA
jgi:hypothetical protein